jgi:hypothetical protein
MYSKFKKVSNLLSNMGLRYILFRVYYAIITKLGIQKKRFPVKPEFKKFINLDEWKANQPDFFFHGKHIEGLKKVQTPELKETFEDIQNGKITFFNKEKINLSNNYDWVTNPITNYKYDISKHWSEIQDLSEAAGDIKFVWEKSRFSYLYDIIRYDYNFEDDQSKFVFSEIEDFIDKNPINQGPNYKCSQEISLRILNWTFALFYYKDAKVLTEFLFEKIMNSVYWQLKHVRDNIHFSRIAVRNNHAITETLMLYLSEKLYPFIPESKSWSKKGKIWFEKEISYQIYEDGTFLQFSMNYHRVVVQLLTWGIKLSELNNDKFNQVVYDRAQKSLEYLDACSDPVTGCLPNYGSNDGALFFKLTNDNYRNYRSQLDDLRLTLSNKYYFESESQFWYGFTSGQQIGYKPVENIKSFKKGGYYIIQENSVKTFIKCGSYKDRPAQSDNLHLDIWVKGINMLRDSGSYKYNTTKENLNYFNGVEGHNTVSISGENQSLKGGRFIWYNWVKYAKANLKKEENTFVFNGTIKAFKNLGNNIFHNRRVEKTVNKNLWNITDHLENTENRVAYQYWHINPEYKNQIHIEAYDNNQQKLLPIIEEKWYSGYYGVKEKSIRLTFATTTSKFQTKISITL